MTHSAHRDGFARDHLPPREEWPDFIFTRPELEYPQRLNCIDAFLDSHIRAGRGDRPCLITPQAQWRYADLHERVNRIANVLVNRLGLVPGERVLLRSFNNAMMVAAYFAVIKAGGIVVATMPMLACPGDRLSAGKGAHRHRPVRCQAARGDGQGRRFGHRRCRESAPLRLLGRGCG